MRKIIALILTASLSLVGIGFAQAANPKAGTKCSTANQKVTYSGKTFTCVKKGKSLVWDAGVPVAKPATSKNATEGFLCTEGSAPAKDAKGNTLYCTKGGDGKSSWRPQSQQGSGGGSGAGGGGGSGAGGGSGSGGSGSGGDTQNTGFKLGQFGASCSKNGEIAWNGLTSAICKNGKVSYLLAADAPKTPHVLSGIQHLHKFSVAQTE